MPPKLDSKEFGKLCHGASSVEHKRFTQHSFKALSNTVKSIMFKPFSSLHFIIVDFLILARLLILPNELENNFINLFGKGLWSVKLAANKSEFGNGKCFDYIYFSINGDVS